MRILVGLLLVLSLVAGLELAQRFGLMYVIFIAGLAWMLMFRLGRKPAHYVYVLRGGRNNGRLYKIGYTGNLEQRMKTHRTSLPFAEYELVLKSRRARALETQLKRRFKSQLVPGTTEWFYLAPKDLKEIKEAK